MIAIVVCYRQQQQEGDRRGRWGGGGGMEDSCRFFCLSKDLTKNLCFEIMIDEGYLYSISSLIDESLLLFLFSIYLVTNIHKISVVKGLTIR